MSSSAQTQPRSAALSPAAAKDAGRALAWASLIVAATYFGSRLLGALRSVAIAHAFGISCALLRAPCAGRVLP